MGAETVPQPVGSGTSVKTSRGCIAARDLWHRKDLKRYKVQHPRDQQTYPNELEKGLRTVPDAFPGRTIRKNRKTHGNEQGKTNKIEKMDHFFLPRLISIASITAR